MTNAPDPPSDLAPDDLARVQTSIDAQKCKYAPGVLAMWRCEDDRYEPVYSRERLNALVAEALQGLEKTAALGKEIVFFQNHRDELIKLGAEEIITRPIVPWRRRQHRLDYLAKENALRTAAGLPPKVDLGEQ
jgi:hypothetical protein